MPSHYLDRQGLYSFVRHMIQTSLQSYLQFSPQDPSQFDEWLSRLTLHTNYTLNVTHSYKFNYFRSQETLFTNLNSLLLLKSNIISQNNQHLDLLRMVMNQAKDSKHF